MKYATLLVALILGGCVDMSGRTGDYSAYSGRRTPDLYAQYQAEDHARYNANAQHAFDQQMGWHAENPTLYSAPVAPPNHYPY